MGKCEACLTAIRYLNNRTPKGWVPFGWGPSDEEPLHFYVFSEDAPDPSPNLPRELDTTILCKVSNPQKRDEKI